MVDREEGVLDQRVWEACLMPILLLMGIQRLYTWKPNSPARLHDLESLRGLTADLRAVPSIMTDNHPLRSDQE
jgi:hypothetical protein